MAQTGGVKRFTVDGVELSLHEFPDYSAAMFQNETVPAVSGKSGVTTRKVTPYFEGTFLIDGSFLISDYQAKKNVRIQLDLMNGRSIIWIGANEVGTREEKSEMGVVTFRWESEEAYEL